MLQILCNTSDKADSFNANTSKVTRLNIYAYFVIVIVGGINNVAGTFLNVLNHQ